jgi:NADH dehydrogenase (ubiquinone) Fe-S protein 1
VVKDAKFVYLLGADEIKAGDIAKDAFVVYQGHHGDNGAYYADVILPGAAYTEKTATYVNCEGRVQSTRAAVAPPSGARVDWEIVRALSELVQNRLPYDDLESIRYRLQQVNPSFGKYDNVDQVYSERGIVDFKNLKAKKDESYTIEMKDFYLTNSISRASSTMAKCSRQFTHGEKVVSDIPELC